MRKRECKIDKYLLPTLKSSGYLTGYDLGVEILLLNWDRVGKFRVSNGSKFHRVIAEGKKDFWKKAVLELKEGKSEHERELELSLVRRVLPSGVGMLGRAVNR